MSERLFTLDRYETGLGPDASGSRWLVRLALASKEGEVIRIPLPPHLARAIGEGLIESARRAETDPPPEQKH